MDNTARTLTPEEQKNRISAMPEFEQYLKKHAEHIRHTQSRMYSLVQQWIMVNRRFRGVTISDSIGGFSSDPVLAPLGVWTDPVFDDPDQPDVHPINIVRPDIRANTNSCLQANAAINISAGKKSAELERMARMAQLIIDHKRRTAWREESRSRLFDAVQKNSAQFIETYYDHSACGVKAKVPKFSERAPEGETSWTQGSAPVFSEQDTLTEIIPDYPRSNSAIDGITPTADASEPEESFEYEEYEVGDTATRQHLAFNIAFDMIGAAKGGLRQSDWLQIHDLWTRARLESTYPQYEFGAPRDWCYALKTMHALMTNEWDLMFMHRMSRSDGEGFKDFEMFEVRDIFLAEDAYRNYKFPEDFEFNGYHQVKKKIVTKFRARKGQTIAEAQKALWGENQYGLRFVWVDDRLVDIITPEEQPVNFRECVTQTQWLPVSGIAWSVPHWDIVQMNDDLTNENTFWMEHNGSNVHSTVLFDSEKFDRADFQYTHVGTKNGGLATGQKMQDVAYVLPQSEMSKDILAHIQFLLQIKDLVSMVQPAQRGEAQKGETYAAQRQQLEQSYGMLTSCVKSFAECLCDWARHQLKLIQKRWTIEQFEAVAAEFGEVWDDEDVEEFAALDIDRDFIIDYEPGTELPESKFAKELKFLNIFPMLMQAVQLGILPIGGALELIRRLANYGDLDVDLTGLDTEESIAQKRFHKLSQLCAQAPIETDMATIQYLDGEIVQAEQPPVTDPATGAVIQEGVPATTKLDRLIEGLLVGAEALPNNTDNHQIHIDFHTRRCKDELASPRTNYLLVACLEELIANHKDGTIQQGQERNLEAAAQVMPVEMLSQAAASGQAQTERDAATAEGQAQFDREQQGANAQGQNDLAGRALDYLSAEADREFQSAQMDKQHQNALALEKAKSKPAPKGGKK